MSQARIGRIRMKAGGAEVRVLKREPVNPDGEDWRGNIVSSARKIAGYATDEAPLVGYFIIGMYADGGTSTGYRRDPERCRVPRRLWPAYIEEIVRENIITDELIKESKP